MRAAAVASSAASQAASASVQEESQAASAAESAASAEAAESTASQEEVSEAASEESAESAEPEKKEKKKKKKDKDKSEDADFEAFKKTMDDYEAFFDSYCEVMENYSSNPTANMGAYLEMTQKYLEVMSGLEALDENEMSEKELAYYLEVMGRIEAKLAKVAL